MPQLTFSKRDPRKATITDADTGQLVYQVKTPRTLIDHTTTMWDSQGHIVAEYERTFLSQKATIRGHRMSLDDFLRKKHIAGSYVLVSITGSPPCQLTVPDDVFGQGPTGGNSSGSTILLVVSRCA